MIHHRRILKVQFDKLKMALPSLVPEPVIITAVTVEIDMEPVLVGRIPFLLLYVSKCPESSSDMVKDTVQYNFDIVIVQLPAYSPEIIIGPKPAVDLPEISCVVSMIV